MPFIVGLVNECSDIDKKLKKCSVDIGGEEEVIIVTNAPNVRCGTRTVVALIGTEFEDESKVEVRNVGGVRSHGMLCDSKMLKWQGGAEGICVQVPDTFKPGDVAPSSKPRMDGGVATEPEKSDKELKAEAKAAKMKSMGSVAARAAFRHHSQSERVGQIVAPAAPGVECRGVSAEVCREEPDREEQDGVVLAHQCADLLLSLQVDGRAQARDSGQECHHSGDDGLPRAVGVAAAPPHRKVHLGGLSMAPRSWCWRWSTSWYWGPRRS